MIGGGLGAMLGGPFGAIIGAAIGAGMGSRQNQVGRQIGMDPAQRNQAIFFTAAYSMVGKMAKADGRVCENEIAAIEKISREALGLDEQTRKYANRVFSAAKDSRESFSDYARQFGNAFSHDQQLCSTMMIFLFQVAMADGELHPQEEEMLNQAKIAFHLPDGVYQSLYARFAGRQTTSSSLEKHYEALGVSPDATTSEIKKAFRQKAADFHPDKIQGKGLPPEFIKFANERLAEINASYQAIMDARK
jgi:DnaJ like chaperone protein